MNRRVTQDDIIYFIVTDRFFGRNKRTVDTSDTHIHGGTLDGILEKLDYLIELGVTTIWVTPVYENIQNIDTSEPYHYYWPRNFEQMDKRLSALAPTEYADASPLMTRMAKAATSVPKLFHLFMISLP